MPGNEQLTVGEATDKYFEIAQLAAQVEPEAWAEMAPEFLQHPLYGPVFEGHRNLERLASGLGAHLIERAGGLLETTTDPPVKRERKQAQFDDFERVDPAGVAPENLADALRNIVRRAQNDPTIEQHPHQQLALYDIIGELAAGKDSGIVNIATSGGKSLLISLLAAAGESIGYRTLILSPTKTISDQLHGADGRRGLGRFTDLVERGVVANQFDGARAHNTSRVVVSTYQSLNNFGADGSIGDFDLVLYDESHLSLGEVTSRTLEEFSPHAIKIGFSATPGETDDHFHSLPIREAIQSGITAPVQAIVYKTGETIQLLDPQLEAFTTRELEQLINLKNRNDAALNFAQDFVSAGRQGIIACLPGSELAHPRFMAGELSKRTIVDTQGVRRKITARAVGNHQISDVNAHILQEFEAGRIDVLTFVKAIELGWDSKAASFLINAGATTSMTRMSQLLGRIIRIKPNGVHAISVDFVDKSSKQQVTALHVLGEETIRSERIFGKNTPASAPRGDRTGYIRHLLNPALYASIAEAEGISIHDLYLRDLGEARLIQEYNKLLEKEGMPEEPAFDQSVPSAVKKAFKEATVELLSDRADRGDGSVLYPDEIAEYIAKNNLVPKSLLTKKLPDLVYAVYAAATMRRFDIKAHDHIDPAGLADDQELDRIITHGQLIEPLGDLLGTLSEEEQTILKMRFGIGREKKASLEEITKIYEVTAERIRQKEARAMSKIRYQTGGRFRTLREFL